MSWVILYRSTYENLKLIEDDVEFRLTVESLLEYWLNWVDLSSQLWTLWKMAFNSTKAWIDKNVAKCLKIDTNFTPADEEYLILNNYEQWQA